jgi:cytochrome P450
MPAKKGTSSTATAVDKEVHAFKRRTVSKGLSTAAIARVEPSVIGSIEVLCQMLQKKTENLHDDTKLEPGQWTEPKNMEKWCAYIGFDIMGSVVMGSKVDTLRKPDDRPVIDAIAAVMKRLSLINHFPAINNVVVNKLASRNKKVAAQRNTFLSFSQAMVKQRVADTQSTGDLFGIIMQDKDPEFGVSELASESVFIMIAGKSHGSILD